MKTFTLAVFNKGLIISVLSFFTFLSINAFGFSSNAKLNTGKNSYTSHISGITVVYTTLEASANEKSVIINWSTASEINNSHFEVESSLDMKVFKTVAIVLDGFTTTDGGKSYKFKEDGAKVKKGKVVYYRLKQIDTDGNINYSPVLKVEQNKHFSPLQKNNSDIQ